MDAIALMSALGQPTRLGAVSLLIEAGEDGLTVGELAERAGTPANTMSVHLAILARTGAVVPRRVGRSTFYSVSREAITRLADFLVRMACCAPIHSGGKDEEVDEGMPSGPPCLGTTLQGSCPPSTTRGAA